MKCCSPLRQKSYLPDGDPRRRLLRLCDGTVHLSKRVIFISQLDSQQLKNVGHTFLLALGKVCGVLISFLFFGVISASSSLFLFPLVPVSQEGRMN